MRGDRMVIPVYHSANFVDRHLTSASLAYDFLALNQLSLVFVTSGILRVWDMMERNKTSKHDI